ncbi:MAG: (2Fe-2S)-binding protein [Erysipelotrichaceae bacterium]|nr:(2Fe-2S)-binding protein [Erysipelotrichaceae bacterium]
MNITLNVNGKNRSIEIMPDEFLLDTLRRLGFKSVKRGCDTGSCGLCTVLLDGRPLLSCSYLSARASGRAITTIEGAGAEAKKIASALVGEGVEQCGFCSPGLVLSILAMKNEIGQEASDEDIKHYLNGNLCRCTGYEGQLRGIRQYLEV